MKFSMIGSKLKKMKESILKKMKNFFERMKLKGEPEKFYSHYYNHVRSRVKIQFNNIASNDHSSKSDLF